MRILVVLRDPLDVEVVRRRCELVTHGHEVAVCYVLDSLTTLHATLDTQRRVTTVLRRALDGSAESIPVFVVSGRDGDGVTDCAEEWGATQVVP